MGDPFTGGNHEAWDKPALEIGGIVIQTYKDPPEISWSNLCVACKGYPQEHTYNKHCHLTRPIDHRMNTSDPDCEED